MARSKKEETVQEMVTDAVTTDAGPLGWQFFWDLAISAKEANRKDFNIRLLDEELPPLASTMAPERQLQLAMKSVTSLYRGKVNFKKAGRRNGAVTFRPIISEEDEDTSSEEHRPSLKTSVGNGITIDREGNLTFQDETSEIAQSVKTAFDALDGSFESNEIRRALKKLVFANNGIALRKSGGFYFVPYSEKAKQQLSTFKGIIEDMSDTNIYMPELPRNDEWRGAVASGTTKTLESEYKALLEEMESYAVKVNGGDLVNNKSLQIKIKEAKELREKADLFRDLLELRNENLVNASDMILEAAKGMLESASEVRELKKAKGSAKAAEMADKLAAKMGKEADKFLKKARKKHEPVDVEDED